MATEVIHEHGEESSNSAVGLIIGLVVLMIFAFLLFYYGLPALRSASSTPQITVPDKIDVNINQPK